MKIEGLLESGESVRWRTLFIPWLLSALVIGLATVAGWDFVSVVVASVVVGLSLLMTVWNGLLKRRGR